MLNKVLAGAAGVIVLAFVLNLWGFLTDAFGTSFLSDLVQNGIRAIRGG